MRAWILACCVLIAPLTAADTVLQAWAYINLIDVPPRMVSRDGSPVSSSASGSGSSANASASETSISAGAFSTDGNLVEGAHAVASTSTTFKVTGSGSGASVPLTFNLGVSGSIYATSDILPSSGPNISVVSVSIRSNVDRAERNGGILMGSQDGYLVIYSTSGMFDPGGSAEGQVKAELDVRLADPLDAIPFEFLKALGVFPIVGNTLADVAGKIGDLISVIEGIAQNIGFPDFNIGPGDVVPVWSVKYFIDNNVPVTVPVVPNDGRTHFMGLSIIAQASSAPIGSGASDYSNTFEVKSVTVDPAYEGDPSEITVTFESGKIIHATRAHERRRAVRH